MAGPIGFWDKSGLPDGWFTDISQPKGWWDEDLLDTSGSTAYSLSCSAGSYSLTGQAALLLYDSGQAVDTHDGADELKRVRRKRRDRESLREQLERAFLPPTEAQEAREAVAPVVLPLAQPRRAERSAQPAGIDLSAVIESGTNLEALLEQDDEEALLALLGAY